MKSIYKYTLLFLLIPAISFANDYKKKHEKSKTLNKSYNVSSNATVDIKNKYGSINVTTWNQNKVEISVKITVKGNDLGDVEEQLDDIDVNFSGTNSLVEAKTVFERRKNSWNFWGKNKKISYQINYTVKMPVSNNVNLSNDYGSIYLDKIEGTANINCDYGKIEIGDLLGKQSDINLDYCSGSTVGSMKDGNINVDYSKITIDNAQNVKVNTDYSTVRFKNVESVNFNSDYGSVEAANAASITGNGDYTSIKIGTLSKNLKLNTDYGSIKVEKLMKGFESVVINSEYAGIKIGLEPGINFNFTVEVQYAGFKRDKDLVDMHKSIEKSSKKYYEGVHGNGKSTSKISIKSQYGGVSLREND